MSLAIELTCPAGVLPSEEAVNLLYGPLPVHEGEALAKAIIETVDRLTRCRDQVSDQALKLRPQIEGQQTRFS
ncbi:hypothetical protein [Mesorhizobium sp. M1348]|uniref:hypothetical protein n=1 Tax=unclassified Mesorhizobium TaxID=325217 RepID=UPI003338BBC2